MFFTLKPPWNSLHNLRICIFIPCGIDRISICLSPKIMVLQMINMLPNNIPIPVIFNQTSPFSWKLRILIFGPNGYQKITIFKQIGVISNIAGQIPLMNNLAIHIDQMSFIKTQRSEQCVTLSCFIFFVL